MIALMLALLVAAAEPSPSPAAPASKPATSEWAQEPTSYRAVPFGASYEEAAKTITFGMCLCTAPGAPPSSMMVCSAFKGTPGLRICTGSLTVGDVAVKDLVTFDDEKLVGATMNFDSTAFPRMKETAFAKYGPPHSDTTGTVQNRMGATFDDETAQWVGKTVTVRMKQRSGKVTEGEITILQRAYLDKLEAATKDKQKGAADAF